MKKLVSFVLAITMMFSLSAKAIAISSESVIDVPSYSVTDIPYDSDQMYNELKKLGFTDSEMLELYEREADKTGVTIRLPRKLADAVKMEYIEPQAGSVITYAEPTDGDVRYNTYKVSFNDIARACGWTGGGTGVAFIIAQVSQQAFLKALVASVGLGWVSAIVSVGGVIFSELALVHSGCTITTKSMYTYDQYEGFGKWYLVDATYKLW